MESKIVSQKNNPFLKREEVVIQIIDKTTPSKEEVIGVIGKGNEVTVVRKIYAGFGKNSFMAILISRFVSQPRYVIPKPPCPITLPTIYLLASIERGIRKSDACVSVSS